MFRPRRRRAWMSRRWPDPSPGGRHAAAFLLKSAGPGVCAPRRPVRFLFQGLAVGKNIFAQRIDALRGAMSAPGVQACVVLSSDPHLSEYLPPRWQARQWLSGFDGSAGTLVGPGAFAGLWTDSRYWALAGTDLDGRGIRTEEH